MKDSYLALLRPVAMGKALVAALFFGALATTHLTATTYHVDAINGSDSTGDGSSSTPYASLTTVKPLLAGGDTVLLYNGNYGSLEYINRGSDIFTDWVTFQAVEGCQPVLDEFVVTGKEIGVNGSGSINAYIRIVGCHIIGANRDNAVAVVSARYVEIDNCLLEVHGPWVGSEADIGKEAFHARYCSNVTVKNCEITRTGVGIGIQGYNILILNNHIHDITHDGIRAAGLVDSLVEGNYIHGLDDGVDDYETDWNKHCDGIHVMIIGSSSSVYLRPNINVIFRGNIIHDIESQGIQINNFFPFPEVRNANLVFENNIFGPVRAYYVLNNAEPVDGLTIRNNTFLYIEGGTSYTSPNTETHRTIVSTNHGLRIKPETTDCGIYNNILVYPSATSVIDESDIFENNVIINAPSMDTYVGSATNIATDEEQFVNPAAFDGALRNTSWAISRSSTTLPINSYDFYGVTRGTPAEAGAAEYFSSVNLPSLGRWEFDNNADDSSGSGHHGTLLGNPVYTTDRASGSHAIDLDGSGDVVSVADDSSLRVTSDITLAAYIKPTNTGTHQNIICKAFNDGYRIRVTNAGKLQLILGKPNSGYNQVVGAVSSGYVQYNEWQHIAATVTFDSGSAEVKFYIEGALDSTVPLTLSGIEDGTGALYIGGGSTVSELFTGLIDNALIFDYALSGTEIQNIGLPNAAPTIAPIDDVLINATSGLEVLAFANDANGDLMTLSAPGLPSFATLVDHHNGRASLFFMPESGDVGSHNITVTVSDGVVSSSTQFNVEVQLPVEAGYWPFDGDSYDWSGWNHPTSLAGSATLSTDAAVGSHALSVNGVDQHAYVSHAPELQITGDITLAAYIKHNGSSGSQNIMAKSMNDGYRLRVNSNNTLQLITGIPNSGSNQVVGAVSTGTVSANVWHHVAVTVSFSGSTGTAKFYIDGVLNNTATLNAPGIEAGTSPLIIGASSASSGEPFNGLIDEVRIYDYALTASEILSLQ